MAYLGGHVGDCLGLADGPNQAGDVDDVASALPQVGEGKLWRQTDQPSAPQAWYETIGPSFLRHSDGLSSLP